MIKTWKRSVLSLGAMAIVAGASAAPAAAQAILGEDAAACAPGAKGPAVLVRAYGFKERDGQLRVQLYGDDAAAFLEKGTKLKRIEVPVTPAGDMSVCVALPRYGAFAMAVLHDREGNGKADFSKDGFGFSRNPKLRLAKPDHGDVVFTAGPGVQVIDVVLNYRKGLLSVGPLVEVRP